jgi:hypothetical protein
VIADAGENAGDSRAAAAVNNPLREAARRQ